VGIELRETVIKLIKHFFDKKKEKNENIFLISTGEFPVFTGPFDFLNLSGSVPALILKYSKLFGFLSSRGSPNVYLMLIYSFSVHTLAITSRIYLIQHRSR